MALGGARDAVSRATAAAREILKNKPNGMGLAEFIEMLMQSDAVGRGHRSRVKGFLLEALAKLDFDARHPGQKLVLHPPGNPDFDGIVLDANGRPKYPVQVKCAAADIPKALRAMKERRKESSVRNVCWVVPADQAAAARRSLAREGVPVRVFACKVTTDQLEWCVARGVQLARVAKVAARVPNPFRSRQGRGTPAGGRGG